MSRDKLNKIVNNIDHQIDHCSLGVEIRNHFTRIMNSAVSSKDTERIIQTAHSLKSQLNQYEPLVTIPSLWNQYVSAVVFDHIMPFDTLNCAYPSKNNMVNLFNFYDDRQSSYIKYSQSVMKEAYAKMDTPIMHQVIRDEDPEFFYDCDHQFLYFIAKHDKGFFTWFGTLRSAHTRAKLFKDFHMTRDDNRDMRLATAFSNDVNNILNQFLLNDHVIKVVKHHYQLTNIGENLCDPVLLKEFIMQNIAYEPKLIYYVAKNLVMVLSWINEHPYYQRFFGTGIIIKIITFKFFKCLNKYHDPLNKNTTLNMSTFTYMCILLILLNKYFGGAPKVLESCIHQLSLADNLAKYWFYPNKKKKDRRS